MSRLNPLGHRTVLLVRNTWWCEPSIQAFLILPLLLSVGSSSQSVQYIHLGDKVRYYHIRKVRHFWIWPAEPLKYSFKLWCSLMQHPTTKQMREYLKEKNLLKTCQLLLINVTSESNKNLPCKQPTQLQGTQNILHLNWMLMERRFINSPSFKSHPCWGSTTMALGWLILPSMRILRVREAFSSLATLIVFFGPSSVQ